MNTINLQVVDDSELVGNAEPTSARLVNGRGQRTEIRLTWSVSSSGRVASRWMAAA